MDLRIFLRHWHLKVTLQERLVTSDVLFRILAQLVGPATTAKWHPSSMASFCYTSSSSSRSRSSNGGVSVIEPKYPCILNGYIHDTTSRSSRMAVRASFGFSTDDFRSRYVQIWWDRCFGSMVYGSSLINFTITLC